MSSICWSGYETKHSLAMDLRRRAYQALFFVLLWTINLSLVFFGMPVILYSKIAPRLRPASR